MKTILAPIDFSPGTREVIAEAAGLAREFGARVVLLHVVEPLPSAVNEFGFMEAAGQVAAAAEADATRRLAKIEGLLNAAGIAASAAHVVGVPGAAILQQARVCGADYIVLGSHGHGALYELIVGSTANRVLKEANCPVLIVPRGAAHEHLTDGPDLDAAEAVEA